MEANIREAEVDNLSEFQVSYRVRPCLQKKVFSPSKLPGAHLHYLAGRASFFPFFGAVAQTQSLRNAMQVSHH